MSASITSLIKVSDSNSCAFWSSVLCDSGVNVSDKYLTDVPRLEDATLIETKWKNSQLRPITWKYFFKSKKLNLNNLTIRVYDQEQHVIQAALAGQGVALVSLQTPLNNKWLKVHPNGEVLEGLPITC